MEVGVALKQWSCIQKILCSIIDWFTGYGDYIRGFPQYAKTRAWTVS
jgi:hypothetical protein